MKRAVFLGLLAALYACVTNPYTGRSQLILIDEQTELAMGVQGYQQLLSKAVVSTDHALTEPVLRVGRDISAVANRPDFKWEFNVVEDDKTINAFCLPGGKIAFYTGIFPIAANDAGLAIIMGHEVSHALARHGAERVSQGMAAQLGQVLLGAALSQADPEVQKTAMAAYGLGVNVGILLPYSRDHESEADRIGLMLAAQAGYDPREGPEVWRRMAQRAGGGGTPEFLSTHPSHETRIENMNQWMPEAMRIYEASAKRHSAPLAKVSAGRSGPPGRGEAAIPAEAARTSVQRGGYRRAMTPQNAHAITFDFKFAEDVWLESIKVETPGRGTVPIEANLSVMGGMTKQFSIYNLNAQDPPLPTGSYRATFVGKSAGRTFSVPVTYSVGR
jgi:predicted Zn-dependent protease